MSFKLLNQAFATLTASTARGVGLPGLQVYLIFPTSSFGALSINLFCKSEGLDLRPHLLSLCFPRALFYHNNPDAAKTKAAAERLCQEDGRKACVSRTPEPSFPTSGWTSDTSSIPAITAATVPGHLANTGKVFSSSSSANNDSILVCQKPLKRGIDFFFGGYIHDVLVCRSASSTFVKSKCWASQRKNTKYNQRLLLSELPVSEGSEKSSLISGTVEFAACDGCPAGGHGGLCQHIFALLLVLEHHGPYSASRSLPGPQSVTSQPRQWGIRKRDVTPQPIMSLTIERPRMELDKKRQLIGCTLKETMAEKH